eukprot:TRINITY_DN8503_c0_g1_i1.p1 TRINITY_DN8503_c0_g1~~TRINITY_DN8503_c0_g1_i1.p1  ORF type:complete len:749 (+),score=118.83 TRINITY_DN8503_c0_g1_i1:136-2382(+)
MVIDMEQAAGRLRAPTSLPQHPAAWSVHPRTICTAKSCANPLLATADAADAIVPGTPPATQAPIFAASVLVGAATALASSSMKGSPGCHRGRRLRRAEAEQPDDFARSIKLPPFTPSSSSTAVVKPSHGSPSSPQLLQPTSTSSSRVVKPLPPEELELAPLSPEELEPAGFTRAQLDELAHVFQLVDTDCNRSLDAKELKSGLRVLGLLQDEDDEEQQAASESIPDDLELDFEAFIKGISRGKARNSVSKKTLEGVCAILKEGMTESSLAETLDADRAKVRSRLRRRLQKRLDGCMRTFHITMSEFAVAILSRKTTARALAFALRSRFFCLWVVPMITSRFLLILFRHPQATTALGTLLQVRGIERGIANLLKADSAFAAVCEALDPKTLQELVTTPGLGQFFRALFISTRPSRFRGFLRYRATARFTGQVILENIDPEQAADFLKLEAEALSDSVARMAYEPEMVFWVQHMTRLPGMDAWIAKMIQHPQGAKFARLLLLAPGFVDRVDVLLSFAEFRRFVTGLLRQPGVPEFVSWLNHDLVMHHWFAELAKRDNAHVFVTEMLLEPGLSEFIVDLLLRGNNDKALMSMLDYWVNIEGSFVDVLSSLAEKPKIEKAISRLVLSPGFPAVCWRFVGTPGLQDLVLKAVALVGSSKVKGPLAVLALAVVAATIFTILQGGVPSETLEVAGQMPDVAAGAIDALQAGGDVTDAVDASALDSALAGAEPLVGVLAEEGGLTAAGIAGLALLG